MGCRGGRGGAPGGVPAGRPAAPVRRRRHRPRRVRRPRAVPRPHHPPRHHRRLPLQHPPPQAPLPPRLLSPRRQAGPYDITTRWTMVMKFMLLPWKPELVFTGVSIMGVNPQNLKFNSHVDLWDSIQNNEYFSFEGLLDVFKQLRIYKTPDRETPNYLILKKTANYEIRSYAPFLIVEAKGDKLTGSSGFNNVTGYIFGKNASSEKIPMTTPVFTQASDDKISDVSIQIVLPMNKDLNSLPAPNTEAVTLCKVEGGTAAVKKFSGRPKEDIVLQKEKDLRSRLLKDGLKPQQGCLLARYNDPRTQSFLMRNEVLIWLNDFTLE